MDLFNCDYFIVGTGIAGLFSALHLAPYGKVLLVTKKHKAESNTNYAQGGIACVMQDEDSIEQHVKDTLIAGDGLCDEKVVKQIISSGPARIVELEKMGVNFSELEANSSGTKYDLGQEGGHSRRRILHVGDHTGRSIEEVLLKKVLSEPNITLMEHCIVIDLITTSWLKIDNENRCVGAYVLDSRTGKIFAVRSPHTILATGGGGKVYLYTTNPDIATGDGFAIAFRRGAVIKNMEFIQFHPTCLYHPRARSFLITEAVRGEGGILVDEKGNSFMEKYDPRGSLATRDIVARAIDNEMKTRGIPCVYLDIRHRGEAFLKTRFPMIYEKCLSLGIDMARDLIPVVPAAHYFCGGIASTVDGITSIPGLYACGEVACTGLHGANRLASNSLLEALVCAYETARRIIKDPYSKDKVRKISIPDWQYGSAVPSDEAIVVSHNWLEVRTCMWDYVGIVRTTKRLERAERRIANLQEEIAEYYLRYLVTMDILELRNIATVARLIILSAKTRKESRGLHYTLDYPEKDNSRPPYDTIIVRDEVKHSPVPK